MNPERLVKKVVKKVLPAKQRKILKQKLPKKNLSINKVKPVINNTREKVYVSEKDNKLQKYIDRYNDEVNKSEQKKLREYYATKFKVTDIKQNQILYETRDGMSFTDSPKTIYDFLVSHKEYDYLNHIIVVSKRHRDNFTELMSNLPKNVSVVFRNSYEYIDALLESKYLFNNSTFQSFFIKKQEQVYVNTWHGTPLKKMGIDFEQANPKDMNNVRRNLLMTDYLLSPNKHVTDMFLRAYQLNYAWNGKVLENGLPRIDNLFKKQPQLIISKLKLDGVVIDSSKPNLVYMPTWSGKDPQHVSTEMAKEFEKFVAKLTDNLSTEYNILIKVHPYQYDLIKDNALLKNNLIPDKYDPNDILEITDLLITDFSSVFFDYLVTGKPIFFYHWNADLYKNDRGTYFDDKLPGPISYTLPQLISQIKSKDKWESYFKEYGQWQTDFVGHENGNVTSEYVDFMFNNNESGIDNIVLPLTEKKKIVLFRGRMGNNGITKSFINLVNTIDKSLYDITVFLIGSDDETEISNTNELDSSVRKVFYAGAANYTVNEYAVDALLKEEHNDTEINKLFPYEAYEREFQRFFGNQLFDVAIDFSGYSYFFAKFIIASGAAIKLAWLHNDLYEEAKSKENHVDNLLGMFPLYKKFDKVISVSSAVMQDNKNKLSKYMDGVTQDYLPNLINISNTKNSVMQNDEQIFLESKSLHIISMDVHLYKTISDIKDNNGFLIKLSNTSIFKSVAHYTLNNANFLKIIQDDEYIGWISENEIISNSSYREIKYTEQEIGLIGRIANKKVKVYDELRDILTDKETNSVAYFGREYVAIDKIVTILGKSYYHLKDSGYILEKFVNNLTNKVEFVPKTQEKLLKIPLPISVADKGYIKTELLFTRIYKNQKFNTSYLAYTNQFKSIIFDISSITVSNGMRYVQLKWFDCVMGWIPEENIVYVFDDNDIILNSKNLNMKSIGDTEYKNLCINEFHTLSLVNTKVAENQIIVTMKADTELGDVKLSQGQSITEKINEFYIIEKNDLNNPKEFITGKFVLLKDRIIYQHHIKIRLVIDGTEKLYDLADINWDVLVKARKMDIIKQEWPVSYFVRLHPNKIIYVEALPNTIQKRQKKIKTNNIGLNTIFKVNRELTSSTGYKYYELETESGHIGFINRDFTNVVTYGEYLKSDSFEIKGIDLKSQILKKETQNNSFLNNYSDKESEGLLKVVNSDLVDLYQQTLEYHKIKKINGKSYYVVSHGNKTLELPDQSVKILYSNYLSQLPIKIKDKDVVFSSIGRLSPEKNQAELIKSMRILVDEFGNSLKLIIMGEGPLLEDLLTLINELGLQKNVFLVGQQNDVISVLKQSDYFVFPSIYEGQGMALLESISLGIPSISTNISTSLEILGSDEKYGYIANGISSDKIADAMRKILTNKNDFNKFNATLYNNSIMEKFYTLIKCQ